MLRGALLDGYRKTNAEAAYIVEGDPWCGHPTWACTLCSFTTTSQKIQTAFTHIRENHSEMILAGDPVVDEPVSELPPRDARLVETSLFSPSGEKLFLKEEGR